METDSFIIHVKTEDIYKDVAEDVERRFDTSNYEIDRPLPMWKNHEKICWIKSKNIYIAIEKTIMMKIKNV